MDFQKLNVDRSTNFLSVASAVFLLIRWTGGVEIPVDVEMAITHILLSIALWYTGKQFSKSV